METTTEYLDGPLDTTTTSAIDFSSTLPPLLSAASALLSDDDSGSNNHRYDVLHPDTHQITFEVPSHSDLERIQHLDTFNTLMRRFGHNVHKMSDHLNGVNPVDLSADVHAITSDQISKSVVVDMADPRNSGASGFERFFQGTDMHSIINYLWIGVVTSLVILSVIFILFSFYFYRKFREWKKCNKDIRAHLNNESSYNCGSMTPCDALLSPPHHSSVDRDYLQKDSPPPPCYTIATGLPTYDEALRVNFSFAETPKFIYPNSTMYYQSTAIPSADPASGNNSPKHKSDVGHGTTSMSKTKKVQKQQQHQLQVIQLLKGKSATVYSSLPSVPPVYSWCEGVATESDGATNEVNLSSVRSYSPIKSICIDLSEGSRNAEKSDIMTAITTTTAAAATTTSETPRTGQISDVINTNEMTAAVIEMA